MRTNEEEEVMTVEERTLLHSPDGLEEIISVWRCSSKEKEKKETGGGDERPYR